MMIEWVKGWLVRVKEAFLGLTSPISPAKTWADNPRIRDSQEGIRFRAIEMSIVRNWEKK